MFQEHFTIGAAFLDSNLKEQIDAAVNSEDNQESLDFAADLTKKWTAGEGLGKCFMYICLKY